MECVFYRMRDIMRLTGLSRSTVYAYIERGVIPAGGKLGRVRVWRKDEIDGVLLNIGAYDE